MGRTVDFVAKPTKMGNKVIILVPRDFRVRFTKVMGKYMKFHGEEILDNDEVPVEDEESN